MKTLLRNLNETLFECPECTTRQKFEWEYGDEEAWYIHLVSAHQYTSTQLKHYYHGLWKEEILDALEAQESSFDEWDAVDRSWQRHQERDVR